MSIIADKGAGMKSDYMISFKKIILMLVLGSLSIIVSYLWCVFNEFFFHLGAFFLVFSGFACVLLLLDNFFQNKYNKFFHFMYFFMIGISAMIAVKLYNWMGC